MNLSLRIIDKVYTAVAPLVGGYELIVAAIIIINQTKLLIIYTGIKPPLERYNSKLSITVDPLVNDEQTPISLSPIELV